MKFGNRLPTQLLFVIVLLAFTSVLLVLGVIFGLLNFVYNYFRSHTSSAREREESRSRARLSLISGNTSIADLDWDDDPDDDFDDFEEVVVSPFPAKHRLSKKEPFSMWEIISGPATPPSRVSAWSISTTYYRVQVSGAMDNMIHPILKHVWRTLHDELRIDIWSEKS